MQVCKCTCVQALEHDVTAQPVHIFKRAVAFVNGLFVNPLRRYFVFRLAD
ncbi:MAG: hypothetical protein ACJAQW_001597 [Paracoccaceae bacterium]|jgi:hypothetical protein